MKKKKLIVYLRTIIKTTIYFFAVFFINSQALSQEILLNEDFTSFNIGNIDKNPQWTSSSNPPTINIEKSSPIIFPSYNSHGGNYIKYISKGQFVNSIIHHQLETKKLINGDILYFSFLLRFEEQPFKSNMHFISLNNSSRKTNMHFLRILAKPKGSGFSIGISKGGNKNLKSSQKQTLWADKELHLNETYLIFVKYLICKDNDDFYLWINPQLSSEPTEDYANIKGNILDDKLYEQDNLAGLDLSFYEIYSPIRLIDGIKLTRGKTTKREESWKLFNNIAYNHVPKIIKKIENITVLENSEDTRLSLREYFFDKEDNTSDLEYSVSKDSKEWFTTTIDTITDELIIDYNERGFCEDIKITIKASDSGKQSTEQSFYVTINPPSLNYSVSGTESIKETESEVRTFTITKTGETNQVSHIRYTLGGTAIRNIDYKAINETGNRLKENDTITFAPNENIKYINLKVVDDKLDENNETISLTLNNIEENQNIKIPKSTATKTIIDDDVSPEIIPDQHFIVFRLNIPNQIIGLVKTKINHSAIGQQNWTIVDNINTDGDTIQAFGITPSGEIHINDAGDLLCSPNDSILLKLSVNDGFNSSKPEIITINLTKKEESGQPNIIYVKKTGSDKNSGYSWESPLRTVQSAINQANNSRDSLIWIASGTYFPNTSYDQIITGIPYRHDLRKRSFILKNNIKIFGGFYGDEDSLDKRKREDINKDGYISQWEFKNKTILSGDIGMTNDKTDNCYHVIYCNNATTNTEINGFSIIDGNANGVEAKDCYGAGIYCGKDCKILISNNTISNNTASNDAGGIYNYINTATITNNCIKNNKAINGGGISLQKTSNICLKKNHITNNTATGFGGGIYCSEKSNSIIINNIISNNYAQLSGGGIDCNNESNPYIINNTITRNSSTLYGGGIFCHWGSTPIIINSILWGNKENNNKPNQFNSSGTGFPTISHSAIEGGLYDYKDFTTNKNMNLNADNNSNKGPQFYNTQKNKEDWRIRISSICKEKGDSNPFNICMPSTDISGYNRTHGNIDIGAYEIPLNFWPKAQKEITYGEPTSHASINQLNVDLASPGTFSYKHPDKIHNAGESLKDTIIFKPNNPKLYSIEDTITIIVNKALLTAIADNKSKKYGEENPELTFKINGFVNNEDSLVINKKPRIKTIAQKNSPVGEYPITISDGCDNNYFFKYKKGTLSINKQVPIIHKWPTILKELTYGQAISELKINTSNSISSVPGSFSLEKPNKILNAGQSQIINIEFTPDDNINYTSVKKGFYINVHKALLELTAEDKRVYYKEPEPKFRITYSGFRNNDNESIFKTKPLVSFDGNWPLYIGEYDILIDLSNIVLRNYKLIAKKGKLTILNNPPSPIGEIPNVIALENSKNTIVNITNYFEDVEDSPNDLKYTITNNFPLHFKGYINSDNQLIIDYATTGIGSPEIISLRATDKYNDFSEQSFTVTVKPGKVNFSVTGNQVIKEGNLGTTRTSFAIIKEGNTNQECTINFEIKGSAENNSDFIKIGDISGNKDTKGKLTFKPDEKSKTIDIDIKQDQLYENDEEIQLIIKNPYSEGKSTASISNFIATKTILNDDHLPEITKDQTFYLDENPEQGIIVGKVEAIDEDDPNSLENWIINSGNIDNSFSINSFTGQIIVKNTKLIDKEKIDNFILAIQVSDGINSSKNENIKIEINDINDEEPIIIPNQSFEIKEGIKEGSIISTPKFTDKDITPSNNNTWKIINFFDSDNDNIPPIIIEPESGLLIIKDADEIDYERNKKIVLLLTVNDGENTSREEAIIIKIRNIQETSENSLANIYPNPAHTITNINSKQEGELFIYNESGKLTLTQKIKEGNNKIYISHLMPGLYYFIIKLKTQTIEKTILIE